MNHVFTEESLYLAHMMSKFQVSGLFELINGVTLLLKWAMGK